MFAIVNLVYGVATCIAYLVLYLTVPVQDVAFNVDAPFFEADPALMIFSVFLALVSVTILLCVSFLLSHFKKNGPEEVLAGVKRQVAIASCIVLASLTRVVVGFYSHFGTYETPDWVLFIFGVSLSDMLLLCAILAFIGVIWFSSRRVVSIRRKMAGDTPLLSDTDSTEERETPAMYQI